MVHADAEYRDQADGLKNVIYIISEKQLHFETISV